jgi:hypothetical protein
VRRSNVPFGVLRSQGSASHCSATAAWRRSAAASRSTAADVDFDARLIAFVFSASLHSLLAERQIPRAGRELNPDASLFRATLCCVLKDLSDFRWPPKYLRRRERHENLGGNRGFKGYRLFGKPLPARASGQHLHAQRTGSPFSNSRKSSESLKAMLRRFVPIPSRVKLQPLFEGSATVSRSASGKTTSPRAPSEIPRTRC